MAPSAAELFKQAAEKRARLAGAQKGGLKKRKSEKPSQADDTPTDLQHAKTLRLDECSDRSTSGSSPRMVSVDSQETLPSEDMSVLATPSPRVSAPSPKNEDRKSETEDTQPDQGNWETQEEWGWGKGWEYWCWKSLRSWKWLEDGSWTWTSGDEAPEKTDGERVHEALHTLNTVDRLDTKDLHKVAEQIEKDNAKFPVKPAPFEAAVPVPTEDPGTEGPGTEGNAPQGESSQKVEDQDGEEAKKAEKERIKKDQNARYNRFKRTLDSCNTPPEIRRLGAHAKNSPGQKKMQALYEAYLSAGENWQKSKLLMSIKTRKSNSSIGLRRWCTFTKMVETFGKDVAEEMRDRKLNDPSLAETETRKHPELPHREDNTAVESVFVAEDCDTSSESAASDTSSSASDDGESSSNRKNKKKSKKHSKKRKSKKSKGKKDRKERKQKTEKKTKTKKTKKETKNPKKEETPEEKEEKERKKKARQEQAKAEKRQSAAVTKATAKISSHSDFDGSSVGLKSQHLKEALQKDLDLQIQEIKKSREQLQLAVDSKKDSATIEALVAALEESSSAYDNILSSFGHGASGSAKKAKK